jgi:hypothetical protein
MYTVTKGITSWIVKHRLNGMEVYYADTRAEARMIARGLNGYRTKKGC